MGNATAEVVLAPYVPRIAAEWDLDAPGALWREFDGTCCFVDISGFTALSERLARRGRIGAEELTEVLNHVFSRMLEVAYRKGGALLKFGGDALLLAFTGDDHAIRASQAAVAMRAALREARTLPTSVGRVNLRMSVGLHSGSFHLFRVGDTHHELLISGPAATETTRMEQAADAGEIVVSPDTAARLPAAAVGAARGAGRLLRWRQVIGEGPGPVPARAVSSAAVETSVPAALRLRLAHGTGESEHRLASVAFIKFQGVDDLLASGGPDRAAFALDTIVRTVQHAADREAVTFLASDIDANGGKIILTTGVPATLEDDEGRLLRAARSVAEASHPLPLRIGVNRGHVFAGDIGTAYRRTFTVMGDTVNLAARLMTAAQPGEILATAPVLDRARTHFVTEPLEPFSVKGKSEPVQAYRVGAATAPKPEAYGTLPFAGRDKELMTLLQALHTAGAGDGGAVLIEGERGIGKTRLVTEWQHVAAPVHVLVLQGEPQSTAVPYHPLRGAMRTVLGVDARDREQAGAQLLAALQAMDEGLLPWAPLLAPVVDAEVPPTSESAAVAEEFVRQRIADLVVATLDASRRGPLLVVAEDAHWFDDTTSEICARLAGAAGTRPWLVCATRRPGAEGGFDPSDPQTRLLLTPFTDDVARELVETATEIAPLRPHERERVVSRSGGNPLFLEELLRIVRASDVGSLPDTLDAVAMREIDALPTTPRRVLRLASVLGRSFDRSLLDRLLAAESIEAGVDTLAELDAQLLPDEEDSGRIRFRHALLQEAAYQSLPFRQRLVLHREVGLALEGDATRDSASRACAVTALPGGPGLGTDVALRPAGRSHGAGGACRGRGGGASRARGRSLAPDGSGRARRVGHCVQRPRPDPGADGGVPARRRRLPRGDARGRGRSHGEGAHGVPARRIFAASTSVDRRPPSASSGPGGPGSRTPGSAPAASGPCCSPRRPTCANARAASAKRTNAPAWRSPRPRTQAMHAPWRCPSTCSMPVSSGRATLTRRTTWTGSWRCTRSSVTRYRSPSR